MNGGVELASNTVQAGVVDAPAKKWVERTVLAETR